AGDDAVGIALRDEAEHLDLTRAQPAGCRRVARCRARGERGLRGPSLGLRALGVAHRRAAVGDEQADASGVVTRLERDELVEAAASARTRWIMACAAPASPSARRSSASPGCGWQPRSVARS